MGNIETALSDNEALLSELARSPALRSFVHSGDEQLSTGAMRNNEGRAKSRDGVTSPVIPDVIKEIMRTFLLTGLKRYSSLTCVNTSGKTLFRAEPGFGGGSAGTDVNFKIGNSVIEKVNIDARVWTAPDQKPLRSPFVVEPDGAIVRYSVPVFLSNDATASSRGAIIVELRGDALLDDATKGGFGQRLGMTDPPESPTSRRFIILLGNAGDILYHTNDVMRHQPVDRVMSAFKEISSPMLSGQSGWKFYDWDGSRWLVAYRPVTALAASVGVAADYSNATRGVGRSAWSTFILFALFGLVAVIEITYILRNTTRSIARVTEGAIAVAGGRLEQRIEVRSNDETRQLAESFNLMTDRLREQIARETESRQFESFMRLSAMLTHDLKNAIAGLSLLVGNMEQKFDREEFRADAMRSLKDATGKLRTLVAKLSEPAQSLSSEHQMARPTDLVPIIKKAMASTIDATGDFHEIVVRFPESLVTTVEADRIEKVFENLLMNALEAMGAKNGTLTVEAGETAQGEIFYSVSDTGPGISAEFQRVKLFRPFATTKKTGIGLGLYACREIVQGHGGRIEVTSSRGSGATFRVVLPSRSKITDNAIIPPS